MGAAVVVVGLVVSGEVTGLVEVVFPEVVSGSVELPPVASVVFSGSVTLGPLVVVAGVAFSGLV